MAKRLKVKEGDRYIRFTILKEVQTKEYPNGSSHRMFECMCDCGNSRIIGLASLRSGATQSCGCLRDELVTTHGMSDTRQYNIWDSMLQRVTNPKNDRYKDYGGRGITVCKNWLNFECFWEDMAEGYSDELTIDRRDNTKGYCKENCQWSDRKTQQRNRRSNHIIKFRGEEKCIAEWAEDIGMGYTTLCARIHILGWSAEKSLTTPVYKKCSTSA